MKSSFTRIWFYRVMLVCINEGLPLPIDKEELWLILKKLKWYEKIVTARDKDTYVASEARCISNY